MNGTHWTVTGAGASTGDWFDLTGDGNGVDDDDGDYTDVFVVAAVSDSGRNILILI